MNKCINTQLVASVNNDALPIMGKIKIKFPILQSTGSAVICPVSGKTIIAYIYDSNDVLQSQKTMTPSNKYITIPTGYAGYILFEKYNLAELVIGECSLTDFGFQTLEYIDGLTLLNINTCAINDDVKNIPNKENLSDFLYSNTGITSKTSELSEFINLTRIFTNSTVIGDIAELGFLTSLTTLQCKFAANLTGDIAGLGNLTALTSFNATTSAIGGKIEDLCVAMFNNGRTSGTLTLTVDHTAVTFHNTTSTTNNGNVVVTFGASSITVSNDSGQIGSYDGTSWTYNS